MSDDRARARRMMRLSELHARARQWQEDPTQDDAAAEFERTGRLPEEFSAAGEPNRLRMEESVPSASPEPPQAQRSKLSLYSRFLIGLEVFLPLTYPVYPPELSEYEQDKTAIKFRWMVIRRFAIAGMLGTSAIGILSAYEWPWWSFIIPSIIAIWGMLGVILNLMWRAIRRDIVEHWKRWEHKGYVKKFEDVCGFIVIAFGFLLLTGLDDAVLRSIFSARSGSGSLWRLSFFIEGSLIASALFSLCVSWEKNKLLSLRRSLAIGICAFAFCVVVMPLAGEFWLNFLKGCKQGALSYIVIALAYLILALVTGMAFGRRLYLLITMPDDGKPIGLTVPAFIRAWRQRPPAEAKLSPQPSQPQFSFQPERVIDLKPQRQRRMPNLLFSTSRRHAAVIWCGRCAGAVVLIYLLAIRFNVIRDDASVPKGMEAYYYAAIAGMILFAIGFLFFWRASKGRFDGGLTGRAIGEVLIAAAIFVAGGQLFPYQPMAAEIIQMVAIFMAVAGSAKFLRLPWLPWKR